MKSENKLFTFSQSITDFRVNRKKLHPSENIVFITILAVICGTETWEDIADDGIAKRDFLQTILDLKNGIPSHDSFNRFFSLLSSTHFENHFVSWIKSIANEEHDGLFVSNGPGDPEMCEATINHLKKAIKQDKPIFGICLGNQLLGLAAGAKTFKLKYGHRSHNQPVIMAGTDTCFVTSQNHGFAIDTETLGNDWESLFINLNDQTCEGIKHKTKPFFSSQFHPEASGGPVDTEFLFGKFMDEVVKCEG